GASVASGQAQSGRFPAVGLWTASTTIGAWGSGQSSRTRHSIAWFDDPISRPTISISPSRSTSRARAVSIIIGPEEPNGSSSVAPTSVDVVAVPARADVTLRVERLATQRARQAPSRDDVEGALHEPARLGRGQPDAERVGAIVVIVVDLLEGGEQLARS